MRLVTIAIAVDVAGAVLCFRAEVGFDRRVVLARIEIPAIAGSSITSPRPILTR